MVESGHKWNLSWCALRGGDTLIFSHVRRLRLFFGGSKFWISIFFGVFRKMNIFGGVKILWIFLGGHHKIGLVWGSFLCNLGVFFKVKVQKLGYFFGLLKFQIFFGGAWNSGYFWGWTVNAGSKPTYAEKLEDPPGGAPSRQLLGLWRAVCSFVWYSGTFIYIHISIYVWRHCLHAQLHLGIGVLLVIK